MVMRMGFGLCSWSLDLGGFGCLSDSLGHATNPQLLHTLVPSLVVRVDGNLFLTSKVTAYEITKCSGLLLKELMTVQSEFIFSRQFLGS